MKYNDVKHPYSFPTDGFSVARRKAKSENMIDFVNNKVAPFSVRVLHISEVSEKEQVRYKEALEYYNTMMSELT